MENQVNIRGNIEKINHGDKGYSHIVISETSEKGYNTALAFEFKTEKVESLSEGQLVFISGYVSSREWNGKYFTSIRGYKFIVENDSNEEKKDKGFAKRADLQSEKDDFEEAPF